MSKKFLVLVPTQFELEMLAGFSQFERWKELSVELCGFGAILSAARTAQLVEQHRPTHAVLLGIAGSYSDGLEVGKAYSFDQVSCYGIGVGCGDNFQTAEQMGWMQWPDEDPSKTIGDTLSLRGRGAGNHLLTCTAAATGLSDVQLRLKVFPDASAEDMEGFPVAAACRLAGVELTIIRGISNVAGDRDKNNWRIQPALQSALELAQQWIDEE